MAVLMGSRAEQGSSSRQHFRLDSQTAGDTQALLLAAGKLVGGLVEVVFDFIPQRGVAEALLDGVGERKLGAVDAQAVRDIVEDRFRERIGALEDHADAAAELGDVLREDVLAVEQDFAFEARVAHGFVHAVEGAQERGLPAAGRADQRGDFVGGDAQVDVEQGLLGAVIKIDLVDVHAHRELRLELPELVVPVPGVGVRFTDTAGLTEACMGSGPRNRNATSKNRTG